MKPAASSSSALRNLSLSPRGEGAAAIHAFKRGRSVDIECFWGPHHKTLELAAEATYSELKSELLDVFKCDQALSDRFCVCWMSTEGELRLGSNADWNMVKRLGGIARGDSRVRLPLVLFSDDASVSPYLGEELIVKCARGHITPGLGVSAPTIRLEDVRLAELAFRSTEQLLEDLRKELGVDTRAHASSIHVPKKSRILYRDNGSGRMIALNSDAQLHYMLRQYHRNEWKSLLLVFVV